MYTCFPQQYSLCVLNLYLHITHTLHAMAYLILSLSLSGNGIIFDLPFCVHLHSKGIGRLLLPAHLQGKLGHVDLGKSTSISKVLRKHRWQQAR